MMGLLLVGLLAALVVVLGVPVVLYALAAETLRERAEAARPLATVTRLEPASRRATALAQAAA